MEGVTRGRQPKAIRGRRVGHAASTGAHHQASVEIDLPSPPEVRANPTQPIEAPMSPEDEPPMDLPVQRPPGPLFENPAVISVTDDYVLLQIGKELVQFPSQPTVLIENLRPELLRRARVEPVQEDSQPEPSTSMLKLRGKLSNNVIMFILKLKSYYKKMGVTTITRFDPLCDDLWIPKFINDISDGGFVDGVQVTIDDVLEWIQKIPHVFNPKVIRILRYYYERTRTQIGVETSADGRDDDVIMTSHSSSYSSDSEED